MERTPDGRSGPARRRRLAGDVRRPRVGRGPRVTAAVPYLRRTFALPSPVTRARLYVTALGVYEIELNGRRVGDHVLAPGLDELPPPTPLRHVRRHRRGAAGRRTSSVRCSATGGTAARSSRTCNGTATATDSVCSAGSRSTHADGSTTVVGERRRSGARSTGPIRATGLYEGETYDARAGADRMVGARVRRLDVDDRS